MILLMLKENFFVAIKALAVVGIGLALFLLWERYFHPTFQPCNVNATVNCNAVINGEVSNTLGIPTPIIGLIGYVVILFAAFKKNSKLILAMATFGLAFCLYIAYRELFQLHVVCPVCILCQLDMITVFVLGIILNSSKNKLSMLPKISTQTGIVISIIFFTLVSIFVPEFTKNTQVELLLGAATFIYGIIIAFFISFATNRLSEVSATLNSEDATFITIYRLTEVFGKDSHEKVKTLLDNYLTATIDYYIQDYDKTIKEFGDLSRYLVNLDPISNAQQQAYSSLLNLLQTTEQNRIKLGALVKQQMFLYEWLVIYVLNSVILFCIFYLNNHTLISIILSVLLSSSTIILILILRDLTKLRWKEHVWVWESLKQTFREMDLMPYFPAAVLKEGRGLLTKGEKVRIVHYPDPYPDFSNKKVEVITS